MIDKIRSGRRLLCLLLALVLTVSGLTACETKTEQSVKSSKTLCIGIDDSYEPYTYIDENGDYAGLDIELATAACEKMGYTPEFVAIKWDNKNDYLANGSIDCIWSCFSMSGREDEYTWVGPYMYSRQVVAVTKDSDIDSLDDLNGKSVSVMSSTKPETIFLERDGDSIPDISELYSMENMEYVFTALEYGCVDAAAGHETAMREYMDSMPGEYRLLNDELLAVEVGVAFDKDNPSDAAGELSEAIDEMKEDGSLNEILEKYGVSADKTGGGVANDERFT
jgi:polar amino acid transport system substrate-binding protein